MSDLRLGSPWLGTATSKKGKSKILTLSPTCGIEQTLDVIVDIGDS